MKHWTCGRRMSTITKLNILGKMLKRQIHMMKDSWYMKRRRMELWDGEGGRGGVLSEEGTGREVR